MGKTLIIGYGNTLRGDDGVGPRLAQRIAALRWLGVQTLAVHQLTPELVNHFSDADLVLFLDASMETEKVTLQRLEPSFQTSSLGHLGGPETLLNLARICSGKCPEACSLALPAEKFDYGEDLSLKAKQGMTEALPIVENIVERVHARSQHHSRRPGIGSGAVET